MKKILFISLAVVLGLSVGLIGCGGEDLPPEGPESIICGSVRDLDEDQFIFDCYHGGPAMRWWVNKINDEEGGIYLSKYEETVPLELVVRDFSLAAWDMATVCQGLVDDGANVLFGGPSTDSIYTLAPVANANSIIILTLEGGASKMVWKHEDFIDKWPYVWINLSFSNWYQIPVLHDMLVAQGISEPKAYVVYNDSEFGHEYRDTTIDIFGADNVIAAGHHPFAATTDDIEDLIVDAAAALGDPANPNYDVFCGFTYDPHLAYIITAADALDFNPPAMIMGPGAEGGSYLLTYGDLLEGLMGMAVANTNTEIDEPTTMTLTEMWDLVKLQGPEGYPPDFMLGPWGHPIIWTGLEMWKQAVETVGHLDSGYGAEVRDVLVSFTEEDPATTVIGNCWYYVLGDGLGGGVIDYQAMPAQLCQWQNGYTEIVGYDGITDEIPKYDVTAPFIYPMTDKWNWLPLGGGLDQTYTYKCKESRNRRQAV